MKTGRPKRLELEQRIELARRYHAGETPKVLAEAYGVSRRHVTRIAKEEQGEGLAVRDPSERVSFRASASELAAFDAEWQTRGFANRSQALNAVLRGRCGCLDVPRDLVAEFCASWRQAKDVSDAGLVLAKAVHRGKVSVSSEDRALLVSLFDLAQRMSGELGQMKDAAQVRSKQDWPLKEEGDVALQAHPAEPARAASGLRLVAGEGGRDGARASVASAPNGGAAPQAGRAVIDRSISNG